LAKTTGLGDDFFIGGYHIGGDIQDVMVHGGPALLDVTDITQSAHSRLGGLRDGGMSITSFMDPAAGQEHAAFSPLPTGDVIAAYLRGQAIGSPAACCVAKQVNYDPTRAGDGMLTFKVEGQGDGFGLEWGVQLTAGARTDTSASNGTGYDTGGSLSFGAQAYLQAVAVTGTSYTVTIQDSADNLSFTNVTGLSFTAVAAAPQAQRISIANGQTVRRYVRAVTTGTFTVATFQVTLVKNTLATVF
jgi:hypothetical protein